MVRCCGSLSPPTTASLSPARWSCRCISIYTPITVPSQWTFFPRFRAHFQPNFALQCNRLLARLGAGSEQSWGRPALVRGSTGARLGPSWAPLGSLGAILEPSWGLLVRSWSRLGAILGDFKRKAAMLKNHRKTQVRMAFGPSKMRPSWARRPS